MFKTLIAASLATALAFGGGATPAMADRDNTVGVIVGITALAAIAAAIAHDNKKAKAATPVRPHPPVTRHNPGPKPPVVRPSKTIPGACVFNFDTGRRGQRTQAVTSNCLQGQRIDARTLPSACRMDARYTSRPRTGNTTYEVACLQRYGYRVAARGW